MQAVWLGFILHRAALWVCVWLWLVAGDGVLLQRGSCMAQTEGTDESLLKGSLRAVWPVCRGGLVLESRGWCSRVLLFLRINRLIFNSPSNLVQKQALETKLAGPGGAVSRAFIWPMPAVSI